MLAPPEITVDAARTYSRRQTAALLDVDPRTIAKMIERGQLSAVEIADHVEITGRSLAELVAKVAGSAR